MLFGWADEKKPVPASAGNDYIEISAQLLLTREEVQTAVGADVGEGIIAISMRVEPKLGKALPVFRDDFILLSHKDGQRSEPFSPGQIAGSGAVLATPQGLSRPGFGRSAGSVRGIPGLSRKPKQDSKDSKKKSSTPSAPRDDAATANLLAALKAKSLPEGETGEPVSGLLLFPLEGKTKSKDLSLLYKGAAGRLTIAFQ